jgi:hypothetical protein
MQRRDDPFRPHKRLVERLRRGQIGHRSAVAHDDVDARIGEPHPVLQIDDTLPVELVHGRLGNDHCVVRLVGLDLLHDHGGRADKNGSKPFDFRSCGANRPID